MTKTFQQTTLQQSFREKVFAKNFKKGDYIENDEFLYRISKGDGFPDFFTIKNKDKSTEYSIFGNKIFLLQFVQNITNDRVEEESNKAVILPPNEVKIITEDFDNRLVRYLEKLQTPNTSTTAAATSSLQRRERYDSRQ